MTHFVLSLEQRKYDIFLKKFKDGKYGGQRLGQAFYNEFNLNRLNDQAALNNIYAKDGQHALNSIKAMVVFQ